MSAGGENEAGRARAVAMVLLPHAVGAPVYASDGAAGADLLAAVPEDAPLILPPLGRAAAPTGVALALPPGVEAQVRPRSGLARRHGVTVLNAPGTIDWDFRGEIEVLLINLGATPFEVTRGMRIAQLVAAPALRLAFTPTATLETTARGAGGFGSTGLDAAALGAAAPAPPSRADD